MSRPPDILTAVAIFRERLAAREAATAAEFSAAFNGIADELSGLIDDITAMIERRLDLGLEADAAWMFQQARFRELLRQTEALVAEYAPTATARITADQRFATELAGTAARQLTLFQIPPSVAVSFTRLPQSALEDLIGALADGSPLRELLDDLGLYASRRMRDELVTGLATGRNPREVARRLRDVPGLTAKRAQLISRTEVHRAYRSSSIRTYEANRDVVQSWIWTSARDGRVCLSCLAMDGQEFPVTTPFGSHPACRCAPRPRTRFTPQPETGIEWFERQSDDVKLRLAGPSKYRALQAAEIDLADLVGFKIHPKYGPTRWERSLRDAIGDRAAREYQQAADD